MSRFLAIKSLIEKDDWINKNPRSVHIRTIQKEEYDQLVNVLGAQLQSFITFQINIYGAYYIWNINRDALVKSLREEKVLNWTHLLYQLSWVLLFIFGFWAGKGVMTTSIIVMLILALVTALTITTFKFNKSFNNWFTKSFNGWFQVNVDKRTQISELKDNHDFLFKK